MIFRVSSYILYKKINFAIYFIKKYFKKFTFSVKISPLGLRKNFQIKIIISGMNIFVMSAGKNVPKILVTAGLAALMQSLGIFSGVLKPVQTGAVKKNGFFVSKDIVFISGIDPYVKTEVPYLFEQKEIPVVAASMSGTKIRTEKIQHAYNNLSQSCDVIFVDFDGNLTTPLSDELNCLDLIKSMSASLLLVSNVNSFEDTTLIAECARNNNIDLRGIILCDYPEKPNEYEKDYPFLLEDYAGINVLGKLKKMKSVTASGLIDTILASVDLKSLFDFEIPKLTE